MTNLHLRDHDRRRTKLTGRRLREILRMVHLGYTLRAATARFGTSRQAVYYHRDRDPEFARALRAAMEESTQ